MKLAYLQWAGLHPFQSIFDDSFSVSPGNEGLIDKDTVILFGGGTDVDPAMYGERAHPLTSKPDRFRDIFEAYMFHKYKNIVRGFLGICRGSQFLTVMNGGKLVQHLRGGGHCQDHDAIFKVRGKLKTIPVTSTHHQMSYPFHLPSNCYKLVAWTPTPLIEKYEFTAHDDVRQVPVEVESVWYPNTKSLAIQGHPEYLGANHIFPKTCIELIKEYLV